MKKHRSRTPAKPPLQREIAERLADLAAQFLVGVTRELVENKIAPTSANAIGIADRRHSEFSIRLREILAEYRVPANMTPEEFEAACLAEFKRLKDSMAERASRHIANKTSRF